MEAAPQPQQQYMYAQAPQQQQPQQPIYVQAQQQQPVATMVAQDPAPPQMMTMPVAAPMVDPNAGILNQASQAGAGVPPSALLQTADQDHHAGTHSRLAIKSRGSMEQVALGPEECCPDE